MCTAHHAAHSHCPIRLPNRTAAAPLLRRCDISCGDDHVAIKSGLNDLARAAHPQFASVNVTVRHNLLRAGMGIAVGSETAGGIDGVIVEHNVFIGEGWSVALHVKTAPQRGNAVENVCFRHNVV